MDKFYLNETQIPRISECYVRVYPIFTYKNNTSYFYKQAYKK